MKKDKKMCSGCEDNFYNGNNPYGVKQCWKYKDAKVVNRIRVHINQSPPYNKDRAEKYLSCYKVKQYAFVSPSALDSKGFWKY